MADKEEVPGSIPSMCNEDGMSVASLGQAQSTNPSEDGTSRKRKSRAGAIDTVNEDHVECGEGKGENKPVSPSKSNRFWSAVHRLLEAHHHRLLSAYGGRVELSVATRAFKKFADQLHHMLQAYVTEDAMSMTIHEAKEPLGQNHQGDDCSFTVDSFIRNGFEKSIPREMRHPRQPASQLQELEEEAHLYSASKLELKRRLQNLLNALSLSEMEQKKGTVPAIAAAVDALSSHLELAHKLSFCDSRRPQRHGGGGFDGGNDDDHNHRGSDSSGGKGDRMHSVGSNKEHDDSDDDSDDVVSKGDENSGDRTHGADGMGANPPDAMQNSVSEAKDDHEDRPNKRQAAVRSSSWRPMEVDKVEAVTHDDAKYDDSGVSSLHSSSSSSSSESTSSFEMVDRRTLPGERCVDFSPLQLMEHKLCLDGSDKKEEKDSPASSHIGEETQAAPAPSGGVGQIAHETLPVSSPRGNFSDLLMRFGKKLCEFADDDSYSNICWAPEDDGIIVKDIRLMENYEAFSYFMRMCGFERNGEPPRSGESLITGDGISSNLPSSTRSTESGQSLEHKVEDKGKHDMEISESLEGTNSP